MIAWDYCNHTLKEFDGCNWVGLGGNTYYNYSAGCYQIQYSDGGGGFGGVNNCTGYLYNDGSGNYSWGDPGGGCGSGVNVYINDCYQGIYTDLYFYDYPGSYYSNNIYDNQGSGGGCPGGNCCSIQYNAGGSFGGIDPCYGFFFYDGCSYSWQNICWDCSTNYYCYCDTYCCYYNYSSGYCCVQISDGSGNFCGISNSGGFLYNDGCGNYSYENAGGYWTESSGLLYPTTSTDIVIVGGTSQQYGGTIFEVQGDSYFSGDVNASSGIYAGAIYDYAGSGSIWSIDSAGFHGDGSNLTNVTVAYLGMNTVLGSDSYLNFSGGNLYSSGLYTGIPSSLAINTVILTSDYTNISSPAEGMVAWDYASHSLKQYTGSSWVGTAGNVLFTDNSSGANWLTSAPTTVNDAINRIAAVVSVGGTVPIP